MMNSLENAGLGDTPMVVSINCESGYFSLVILTLKNVIKLFSTDAK